jgi:hypothetical protein
MGQNSQPKYTQRVYPERLQAIIIGPILSPTTAAVDAVNNGIVTAINVRRRAASLDDEAYLSIAFCGSSRGRQYTNIHGTRLCTAGCNRVVLY